MDILKQIDALAERARLEEPPETHVSVPSVLQEAAREQWARDRYKPLAWSAAVAAAAACLTLVVSLHGNRASTDTVSSLFTPLQVEMP